MRKRYGVLIDPAWMSLRAGSENDGIVADVAGCIPGPTSNSCCCEEAEALLPPAGKNVRLAGSEPYQRRSS